MNRITTLMIAFTLSAGIGEVQAAIIADARVDFLPGTTDGDPGIVPASGTGEWRYLASNTVNPTLDGSLDALVWSTAIGGGPRYIFPTTSGSIVQVGLQDALLASDELGLTPSASSRPPAFDVVRWIAGPGEAGIITIEGTVRITGAGGGPGGDGMTFDIFVDGVSIFSQFLAPSLTPTVAFNKTATISVGSTVDFVAGPKGSDSFDSMGFKATITPIPEPTTLVIWTLLAMLGLSFCRRRRRRS